MKEKEKEIKSIKVTAEEQISVFKGVRPEGMDMDVFRRVRKDLAKSTKLYLGGKYKHLSINMDLKSGLPPGEGTYVKTKPKRYEVLNRAWQKNNNIISQIGSK